LRERLKKLKNNMGAIVLKSGKLEFWIGEKYFDEVKKAMRKSRGKNTIIYLDFNKL